MKLDVDYIRRQYASLSDDDLLEIDPSDLVEEARQCFDEELARRGLSEESATGGNSNGQVSEGDDSEPEWLEEGISVFVVLGQPGAHRAPKAQHAVTVLRAAGLPVYLSTQSVESEAGDSPPQVEYHVMVPGELSLHATSVLDREIFNADVEATWVNYFRGLPDEELREADTELLFAGFRDRLRRVTKAYKKEMGRRGFELEPTPE